MAGSAVLASMPTVLFNLFNAYTDGMKMVTWNGKTISFGLGAYKWANQHGSGQKIRFRKSKGLEFSSEFDGGLEGSVGWYEEQFPPDGRAVKGQFAGITFGYSAGISFRNASVSTGGFSVQTQYLAFKRNGFVLMGPTTNIGASFQIFGGVEMGFLTMGFGSGKQITDLQEEDTGPWGWALDIGAGCSAGYNIGMTWLVSPILGLFD